MPGQPLKRACHRALDANEEEIFERLAGGEFVTSICEDLLAEPYAKAGKEAPNTYLFYSWLDKADGRRERYDRVREAAADAMAEDSVRLLDEARSEGVESTAEATLVRAQSSARQWWASKLNRMKYGEAQPGVQVNVGIGELHLEALRKAGHMDRLPEPRQVLELEGEVVEDGEAEEKR